MAKILTTASKIECSSKGTATLSSTASLRVAGAPVLLEADATHWPILLCKKVTGNSNTPCSALASVTGGVASKLRSDGSGVLLESFTATTFPEGPTSHTASASDGRSELNAS